MKLIPVWHGHHNILISLLPSVEERVSDIQLWKPKAEHALRKRLIKLVEGELPVEFVKSVKVFEKAWVAYEETGGVYGGKAWEIKEKAWVAYEKIYQKCLPAIEKLHTKECPDCPWDGKTIFGNGITVPMR